MSATGASESVILCEGYYDRAFWAGWLEHLGCPPPSDYTKICDPAKKPVTAG